MFRSCGLCLILLLGGGKVEIERFRPLVKNTKFFVNGVYTAAEAEEVLKTGQADAVVVGRAILNTPDFALRALRGVEPNAETDWAHLYNVTDGNVAKGYSDYPFYEVKA